MRKIDQILAATDLSAPARNAAHRGALIAEQTGAAIEVMHVLPVSGTNRLRRWLGERATDFEQKMKEAAEIDIRKLVEGIAAAQGVTLVGNVVNGVPTQEIIDRANISGADIMVVGASGAHFVRRHLLGSTAQRLIRKAPCPVLVVKRLAHVAYRRILVPVDFSAYSLPAILAARAISPSAQIVLLHAFEAPFESKLQFAGVEEVEINRLRKMARDDARRRLNDLCGQAGGSPIGWASTLTRHGDTLYNILVQEQEQGFDLIVMGKRGNNVIDDVFVGTTTGNVLAESQSDVLVCTKS